MNRLFEIVRIFLNITALVTIEHIPVAQIETHAISNTTVMGSITREYKNWLNLYAM